MSILWRSWITFTAIIATVLIVLAVLSSLQHNALYSDLIRQRLSVVAQTSADTFAAIRCHSGHTLLQVHGAGIRVCVLLS